MKEEQDWSSASDALLNGYFALDLKLLSQGLTCIPAYERLQLPKRIFTVSSKLWVLLPISVENKYWKAAIMF